MKARIIKQQAFWVGQIYGTWSMLGIYERDGWGTVTEPCFTKIGAKRELMKWKKKNFPEEMEL